MPNIFEIIPTDKLRVIDLVRESGFDVSDWSDYRGKHAAANPKYCYEWSFVQGKKIVLNIWYENVEWNNGEWIQNIRPRDWGLNEDGEPLLPVWVTRAETFDNAIQYAFKNKLPIRVIMNDGRRRKVRSSDKTASKVKKRVLDPVPWAVTSYNQKNGDCTLTRGADVVPYVDQFSVEETTPPQKRSKISSAYDRKPIVRRQVMLRANGKCEYCGDKGFVMGNGKIYIETHDVRPLSEGGHDVLKNVVALCPVHHRQAHFSKDRVKIKKYLQGYLRTYYVS